MSNENRNVNNRSCHTMRSREELMDILTKVSFAMDDTRLFLNTHPNCKEAMEYFHKMQRIRHEIMKELTERFGPISSYHVAECDEWQWNNLPHPWLSKKKGGC